MSNEIINVTEYAEEGFAILEDNSGKFVYTKASSDPIPLPDKAIVDAWFGHKQTCALLQSRAAMLT